MDKKYYFVIFKWDDTVYCSNIVHASDVKDIEKKYSKYGWHHIREVEYGELEIAKEKGMPIIEL